MKIAADRAEEVLVIEGLPVFMVPRGDYEALVESIHVKELFHHQHLGFKNFSLQFGDLRYAIGCHPTVEEREQHAT
jgi:hypothetical protein